MTRGRARKRHILVLTDQQLLAAANALGERSESFAESGENMDRTDSAALDALRRQRKDGLNSSERTFAMREIVRQSRAAAKTGGA